MKNLLTICLLIATAFTVNAQDMNFEETVKYINDKIECCYQYKPMTFTVTRSGQISFNNKTVNLFDLGPAYVNYGNVKEKFILQESGISLWDIDKDYTYKIYFRVSEAKGEKFLEFSSRADAERVYKALLHLRSLCTKAKDPFDK